MIPDAKYHERSRRTKFGMYKVRFAATSSLFARFSSLRLSSLPTSKKFLREQRLSWETDVADEEVKEALIEYFANLEESYLRSGISVADLSALIFKKNIEK